MSDLQVYKKTWCKPYANLVEFIEFCTLFSEPGDRFGSTEEERRQEWRLPSLCIDSNNPETAAFALIGYIGERAFDHVIHTGGHPDRPLHALGHANIHWPLDLSSSSPKAIAPFDSVLTVEGFWLDRHAMEPINEGLLPGFLTVLKRDLHA